MAVANKIIRVKMHKVARIGAPQAISTQPVCDTVTVYQYDDMGRLVQTTDRAGLISLTIFQKEIRDLVCVMLRRSKT